MTTLHDLPFHCVGYGGLVVARSVHVLEEDEQSDLDRKKWVTQLVHKGYASYTQKYSAGGRR